MRVDFRQGLLRFQTDIAGNPTFLRTDAPGVDLIVSPDPTLLTFADDTEDYSFEERVTILQAWPGPFLPIDYWLFWDINIQTAIRTFDSTTLEPFVGFNPPPTPAEGQMWFDKTTNTQKVFSGNRFIRVLRVLAAKLAAGAVLEPEGVGSQAGLWTPVRSGFILFDENDAPVKRQGPIFQQRFLTTDSPLASQFTGSAEFRLEGLVETATSVDNIPAWSAVSLKGPGQLGLASTAVPDDPAVGLINEDAVPGEVLRIITFGFYTSSLLSFPAESAGLPLFYNITGTLTTLPPQQFSTQQVGTVVNANTIFVDIKSLIRLQ